MSKLNSLVEWDTPFTITEDGRVSSPDALLWAPEVFNDPADDVEVFSTPGQTWEPLTGFTGQHGYRGAVMHPSESLAGALERHILSNPGTYVLTEVRGDDESDDALIGWCVLKLDED